VTTISYVRKRREKKRHKGSGKLGGTRTYATSEKKRPRAKDKQRKESAHLLEKNGVKRREARVKTVKKRAQTHPI